MRLTLRTLLAWIDGILPAAEHDELGGKVALSPVAPKLVERISLAIESPSLPVPAGSGPADKPNAVAEFLDNVLPAEQLEAFERACLESQVHLADVASCHRLLAEAARDPEKTNPPTGDQRRRLIRAIAEGMSGEPEPSVADELPTAAVTLTIQTNHSRGPTPGTRAAQSPRASVWAWLSAVAAIALMVVLGGILARSIWPPSRGPGEGIRDLAAVAPGPILEPDTAEAPLAAPAAAAIEPETAAQPDAAPAVEPSMSLPPTPPIPQAREAVVPLPLMEAVIEPAEGPADHAAIEALEAEPKPAEPDPPPGRVAAGDPLLRIAPGDHAAEWRPALAGDSLAASEELLVPAHCFPVLEWGDLRIRLLPGTKAAVITDGDGTPRLEILFGRGAVWTEAPEGAAIGLSAAGLSGVATIGPQQLLGIEVHSVHRPGDDPAAVAPSQQATVSVSGGVEWRQTVTDGGPPSPPLAGIEPVESLPPASVLAWNSADPGTARRERGDRQPDWLGQSTPILRLDRWARAAVVRCLESAPADRSVGGPLRELANDLRVENRMAATSTLALIGEYDELVSQLCLDEGPKTLSEAQWRALNADTIPLALGRGANAAARLRQAFVALGPAGRGETLFRLARGFSPADLAGDSGTALVADLEDPLLAIRRFALANLLPLAADDSALGIYYRPDREVGLNKEGLERWRKRVGALGEAALAAP